jgi:two-component system, LytTR family, sensor kinase
MKTLVTRKNLRTHLTAWLLYTTFYYVLDLQFSWKVSFIATAIKLAILSVVFYANALHFYPNLFIKGRRNQYYLSLGFLVIVHTILSYLARAFIFPLLDTVDTDGYSVGMSIQFIALSIWVVHMHVLFSIGYYYFKEYNRLLKINARLTEIVEDQQKKIKHLTKSKEKAVLKFLRAQINPHFLFNTLNFLYMKARNLSDDFGYTIMQLSKMMRHTVTPNVNKYGQETDENFVLIIEEFRFVDSYIELQLFRFDGDLNYEFNKKGDYMGKLIPPMVLVTFVENAFKHGDLSDPDNPCIIEATLENGNFLFSIQNKIGDFYKDETSGIGVFNICSRMELLMPDQWSLESYEKEGYFYTKFRITNF